MARVFDTGAGNIPWDNDTGWFSSGKCIGSRFYLANSGCFKNIKIEELYIDLHPQ